MDEDIAPVEGVQPVVGPRRVQEPSGRQRWRRWMSALARDQLRVGRRAPTGRDPDQEAERRALEDELTGEGQVLDVDA